MKISKNEKKLLEIAKQVIELNSHLNAALTGSLMLSVRSISKSREAKDIDILCDYLCEKDCGLPIVPNGFKIIDMTGRKSQVDSIAFENNEGTKIDFMQSHEKRELLNGILCGSIEEMMKAKENYSQNDLSEESREKHIEDLIFHANKQKKKEKRQVTLHIGNGSPMRTFKPGRNNPCRCGSGKKQKNCCGTNTKFFYSKKTDEQTKSLDHE